MSSEWFAQMDGGEFGPCSGAVLKQYAAEGRVIPTTQVKKGKEGHWVPAQRVKGLFASPSDAATGTSATYRRIRARIEGMSFEEARRYLMSISKEVDDKLSEAEVNDLYQMFQNKQSVWPKWWIDALIVLGVLIALCSITFFYN